jgi:hypothetical protein
MKHAHPQPGQIHHAARAQIADGHVACDEIGQQRIAGFAARDADTQPRLPHRQAGEHTGSAARVIRIAVRDQQRRKRSDAARPQRRRDHSRADVEAAAKGAATGVDEQRRSGGRFDDDRLTLTHVQHGQARLA